VLALRYARATLRIPHAGKQKTTESTEKHRENEGRIGYDPFGVEVLLLLFFL
jgi:hypothetical protein